jgi:dUTP pyrophosphatase
METLIPIKIKKAARARLPEYKSTGSSGADLFACIGGPVSIAPGETVLIPTGIYLEIPDGYEAQIRPRSGLAINHGITLLNTPGTIDSDYRGEIRIIVANMGKKEFTVEDGMRIAQMTFNRVYRGRFLEVEEIGTTERNDGGFGHTGI